MTEEARIPEKIGQLIDRIEQVIVGKRTQVELVVTALIARGHLMLSDVPGVGKTTLAQCLARSVHASFQRIQFTNDMLPSDVIGVSVYDPGTRQFSFRPGPIFGQIILADEINRTTPKTQSALLEAMSDGQVTVDNFTHPLPRPFMVLATLNPLEFAGTFVLPESQMDRFLMRLSVGYPDEASERAILRGTNPAHRVHELQPVLDAADVLKLQEMVDLVRVEEPIIDYILTLVRRTREDDRIQLGVSPRGALAFRQTARALALVRGRDFVLPDDVKQTFLPCCAHRLILSGRASLRSQDFVMAEALLNELLADVPVPL